MLKYYESTKSHSYPLFKLNTEYTNNIETQFLKFIVATIRTNKSDCSYLAWVAEHGYAPD